MDRIIVRNLSVSSLIGVDNWERLKRQPIRISVVLFTDISAAGENDDLNASINYATVTKRISEFVESNKFKSMESLGYSIMKLMMRECNVKKAKLLIEKPKGLLHASSAGIEMSRILQKSEIQKVDPSQDLEFQDKIIISDLQLSTIVGVNPWERQDKQLVQITIKAMVNFTFQELESGLVLDINNYRKIAKVVTQLVENSQFYTLEALATAVTNCLINEHGLVHVHLTVKKPSALLFADYSGVEIVRKGKLCIEKRNKFKNEAFIAFGSNLGDRYHNVLQAIKRLQEKEIHVVNSSFLYETSPMYVVDQPAFLNGVLQVETEHDPFELLKKLKEIEAEMKRNFETERNGPRIIDLDILLYEKVEMNTPQLVIPHPRIAERQFVLQPLCDLIPQVEHPLLYRTFHQLLCLLKHSNSNDSVFRVLPIGSHLIPLDDKKTLLMGILNATPDSFSDGGQFNHPQVALDRARQMVSQGADIIDIGGQSTRPGADLISPEEEMERIIPIIRLIRSATGDEINEKLAKIPISVDTFRAQVAKAALEAGADMINDVTGTDFDKEAMVKVLAENNCPVCLMHMRGNPKTMNLLTDYDNVILEVAQTLSRKSQEMIARGLLRWNLIVDPGIGFAKNAEQNFEILKNLPLIQSENAGLPILVGVSRKRFIGSELEPSERVWGTAGACSAAIAGGAKILRVHDVAEMKQVASVADLCFK